MEYNDTDGLVANSTVDKKKSKKRYNCFSWYLAVGRNLWVTGNFGNYVNKSF